VRSANDRQASENKKKSIPYNKQTAYDSRVQYANLFYGSGKYSAFLRFVQELYVFLRHALFFQCCCYDLQLRTLNHDLSQIQPGWRSGQRRNYSVTNTSALGTRSIYYTPPLTRVIEHHDLLETLPAHRTWSSCPKASTSTRKCSKPDTLVTVLRPVRSSCVMWIGLAPPLTNRGC